MTEVFDAFLAWGFTKVFAIIVMLIPVLLLVVVIVLLVKAKANYTLTPTSSDKKNKRKSNVPSDTNVILPIHKCQLNLDELENRQDDIKDSLLGIQITLQNIATHMDIAEKMRSENMANGRVIENNLTQINNTLTHKLETLSDKINKVETTFGIYLGFMKSTEEGFKEIIKTHKELMRHIASNTNL